MSGKVLARVVASKDRPRGPDVQLHVTVPASFIVEGATLEVDVPRNLACAACGGGGCDACDRAGAVSIRGRKDPPESVEVTLPKANADSAAPRAVLLRIPERGGPPPAESGLPRGNLLLTIRSGDELSTGVSRLPGPSVPPPPVTPELVGVERDARAGQRMPWLLIAVAVFAALMAWWLSR
ncbi:MAG TPA: hypothetical protein VH062_28440 [Polyangiaceae bacterium]|jgi:hypothetical protein|nr:hypothetical protein [Polyangiaceae bacterium]